MLAEPAAVAAAVQRLAARLRQQEAEGKRPLGAKDALALRLNSQYPEVTADTSAEPAAWSGHSGTSTALY